MERAEKEKDEDLRESPHDEEEPEEAEDAAEASSDITVSRQVNNQCWLV